jgi:hypothetical protein
VSRLPCALPPDSCLSVREITSSTSLTLLLLLGGGNPNPNSRLATHRQPSHRPCLLCPRDDGHRHQASAILNESFPCTVTVTLSMWVTAASLHANSRVMEVPSTAGGRSNDRPRGELRRPATLIDHHCCSRAPTRFPRQVMRPLRKGMPEGPACYPPRAPPITHPRTCRLVWVPWISVFGCVAPPQRHEVEAPF